MFKLSQNSLKKLEGVHPKLVELCVETLKVSPIDFSIVQGVRTKDQQEALFAQGRRTLEAVNDLRKKVGWAPITVTENKYPVTWTLNSDHIPKDGCGHAIDFAAYVDGKISWDEKYYFPIADTFKATAKKMGLEVDIGAYWAKRDLGHIALK